MMPPLTDEDREYLNSALSPTNTFRPSMDQALRRNPDQYAETLRLSESQRLPTDIVERNMDEVKRRERLNSIDLSLHPKTAAYLSDPNNASVSSDDVPNLQAIEDALTSYQRPWYEVRGSGVENTWERAKEGFKQMGRGFRIGVLDAGTEDPDFDETNLWQDPNFRKKALTEAIGDYAKGEEKIKELAPKNQTMGEQMLDSAVQSWIRQALPWAATLATRNPAFALGGMAAQIAPESYGKGREAGLTPTESLVYSSGQTGVNVITEVLPVTSLVRAIGGNKVMKNLSTFALSEVLGEQLATGLETVGDYGFGLDEDVWNDPDLLPAQKWSAQLDRQIVTLGATVIGASGQAGLAGGIGVAVGAADRKINGDLHKVGRTLNEQSTLDAAIELAQSNLTQKRSPERYVEFLKAVGGDTQVTIPGEATADLEGLPSYLEPGVDAEIGMELFMRDIAIEPDWMKAIRPHIKLTDQAYSQLELERDDRADLKKIMAQAQKTQDALTEAEAIFDQVKDQIVATERQSDETARLSAQLYPAFATVMSEKLRSRGHDVSPAQVFADMGFKVIGPNQTAPAADPADVIVDQEDPAFKNWFGDSKVVDEEGAPVRVYRGSQYDWEAGEFGESSPSIQKQKGEYWFSDKASIATGFADPAPFTMEDMDVMGMQPQSIPAYLSIKKHLVVDSEGETWANVQGRYSDSYVKDAKSLGRDGLIIKNIQEGSGGEGELSTSYVAFEPTQIKSAVGNRGTYDPTDPNILNQEEKDGRAFKNFFSNVVNGLIGKSDTGVEYTPVIQGRDDLAEFAVEYGDHRGNFDDHITFSIPGYKEVQMAVGNAITEVFGPTASLLDIGASQGSFGKTITSLGGPQTVSMDPNPDMARSFDEISQVPGATYSMTGFSQAEQEGVYLGWKEGDVPIVGFTPDRQFDVVHEAMTFQFIENDRPNQIARMKELMKPDGVLIIEEKFHNDKWDANETKKDKEHKSKYFHPKDMTEKAKEILEGMNKNMTDVDHIEEILTEEFDHVVQFWDSGNFRGYIASNNVDKVDQLVDSIGDVSSEFSTIKTPREVISPYAEVTLPVETVETGETTDEVFGARELLEETDGKLETYRQLLDCLK